MKRRIAASYDAASTPRCVATRCSLRIVIGAPRVGDRRGLAGDPVVLGEPAAEVHQVTALAAEREQLRDGGIALRDGRLARRARDLHGATPGSVRESRPSAVIRAARYGP